MEYPTQKELRSALHYDPQTGLFTWLRPARVGVAAGDTAGRITSLGYWLIGFRGQKLLGHRLAWLYMTGGLPGESIDHINGKRSDNRWANLRIANRYGQAHNQGVRKSNATGKKGVYAKKEKFRAAIRANGSGVIHLGTYDTLDEAAHAYNKAAIRLHGQFACLNPIGVDT